VGPPHPGCVCAASTSCFLPSLTGGGLYPLFCGVVRHPPLFWWVLLPLRFYAPRRGSTPFVLCFPAPFSTGVSPPMITWWYERPQFFLGGKHNLSFTDPGTFLGTLCNGWGINKHLLFCGLFDVLLHTKSFYLWEGTPFFSKGASLPTRQD